DLRDVLEFNAGAVLFVRVHRESRTFWSARSSSSKRVVEIDPEVNPSELISVSTGSASPSVICLIRLFQFVTTFTLTQLRVWRRAVDRKVPDREFRLDGN